MRGLETYPSLLLFPSPLFPSPLKRVPIPTALGLGRSELCLELCDAHLEGLHLVDTGMGRPRLRQVGVVVPGPERGGEQEG